MRKSLLARIVRLFMINMIIASLFSLIFIAVVVRGSSGNEIRAGQSSIAIAMIELDQRTDFDLERIIKFASNPLYAIRKVEDIQALKLKAEELSSLETNGILFVSDINFTIARTLVKVDGNTLMIENKPKRNIYWNTLLRTFNALVFMTVVGTIIIIIRGKKVLQPIYRLNEATKEVAKGNFNIQLENTNEGEIGELTGSFNKMAQELKNMEIFRRDFINNVSHEFKTPIASIQGFAKLLQSGDLTDEEKKEYADIIVKETERISRLSSNILKLSKLENQLIILDQADFSLDEQIRRTFLLLENEWSGKNLSFNLELEEIVFHGNEELLQQVWLNLLGNAVKFSHPGGEITVKLYNAGSRVVVKVIDNGIGMSEETQKRIFEKFYQGDKTHASEGNGLGLALVKRIIDLCGGSIAVQSEPRKGSTFRVELPSGRS